MPYSFGHRPIAITHSSTTRTNPAAGIPGAEDRRIRPAGHTIPQPVAASTVPHASAVALGRSEIRHPIARHHPTPAASIVYGTARRRSIMRRSLCIAPFAVHLFLDIVGTETAPQRHTANIAAESPNIESQSAMCQSITVVSHGIGEAFPSSQCGREFGKFRWWS